MYKECNQIQSRNQEPSQQQAESLTEGKSQTKFTDNVYTIKSNAQVSLSCTWLEFKYLSESQPISPNTGGGNKAGKERRSSNGKMRIRTCSRKCSSGLGLKTKKLAFER